MEAERPDRQSAGSPEPVQELKTSFSLLDGLLPYMQQDRAPATIVLIAVNVVVFVVMVFSGGVQTLFVPSTEFLQEWGANFGPLTFNGESWRILTACFIHIGIVHLLVNMYVLWDFGSLVERLYGTRYYLMLYFLAGLGGSCVSLLCIPTMVSAGASGAIFGVVGGVFACFYNKRKSFSKEFNNLVLRFFVMFVLLTAVMGTFTGLDNGAHFGGLAIGFLCGLFFFHERSSFWYRLRFLGVPLVGALVFGLYRVALTTPFDFDDSYAALSFSIKTASMKKDRALQEADRFIAQNPDKGLAYIVKADLFAKENNLKGALEFYNKALEKEPGLKQAYAGKAFTEMRSGDYGNAIVDATSAIDKDESEIPVYYARMMSYSALGEYEKALADCKKLIAMGGMSKADYLVDRARLYRNKGDTKEALAELDRIIDKKPDLIRALATRAYMLYQSGNRDAALSDLVRIYSVKEPATEYEYLNRAYASLIFDRDREVLRDVFALFEKHPDEKEPLTYAGILGSLAAKEAKNDKDMQVIRARLEKTASMEFWPFPIAAYVFGDIDDSKLLAMAGDNVSRLTEARAFVGYLSEIQGDRESALSNYRWVVEKGNKFFMEYDLAQVRLRMLEHPQPSN